MSQIGEGLLFKTHTLTKSINDLRMPEHGFIKNIATSMIQFEEEEILFDLGRPTQFLAPFVLPTVRGKTIQERSYSTKGFRPPYIKMRTPCDIYRAFRRGAGEQIGGSATPRQRAMMAVAENLAQHKDIWMNRLEWMLANLLVHGGYAIYAEDYPLEVIDFGRPKSNDIVLTGSDTWDNESANISDFLQDWASLFAKNGGGRLADVILGVGAWKGFRNNERFEKQFDWATNQGNDASLDVGAVQGRGLQLKGTIENFRIWVYQDWYISDGFEYVRDRDSTSTTYGSLIEDATVNEGDLVPFVPINGAIGVDASALMATRAYGAIKDEHFMGGMTAMPLASRSFVKDEEGQRVILTQSAPLIFPYRPMSAAYAETYTA